MSVTWSILSRGLISWGLRARAATSEANTGLRISACSSDTSRRFRGSSPTCSQAHAQGLLSQQTSAHIKSVQVQGCVDGLGCGRREAVGGGGGLCIPPTSSFIASERVLDLKVFIRSSPTATQPGFSRWGDLVSRIVGSRLPRCRVLLLLLLPPPPSGTCCNHTHLGCDLPLVHAPRLPQLAEVEPVELIIL